MLNQVLQEKSVIQEICSTVIHLRQYERLIHVAEQKVDYYDEQIAALQQSFSQGEDCIADVWKVDEERHEYIQKLNSYYQTRQSAYETLCLYCGSIEGLNVMASLPSAHKRLFGEGLNDRVIRNQKEQLDNNYVLQRQGSAPTLTLKGSVAESTDIERHLRIDYVRDKNYLSWGFTVVFDFSNLSFRQGRLLKQSYQNGQKGCDYQLRENHQQFLMKGRLYDSLVQIYTDRVEKSRVILENQERYCRDVEQEYLVGGVSRLEMLAVRNEFATAECTLRNDEDLLWYYTWLWEQLD